MDNEKLADWLFQQLKNNASCSLTGILNDFNRGEIGVLSYLAFDKNEITAGELSDALNVTTARIASILNSLEIKEFIKRLEDKEDKRKTIIVITNKGKKLAYNAKEEIINKIIKIIKVVGEKKIKEYVKVALEIKKVLSED